MQYLPINGLPRPVSQVVLGSVAFEPSAQSRWSRLLDAWLDSGGNLVDTARHYGRGKSEHTIGAWLAHSGRRDELLILTKGCHFIDAADRLTERDLREDLFASLDALGVETIDLYLLHRDDPSIPVGEIIGWLHEHQAAGRVRAYGGSNWSPARVDAANQYARDHGLSPLAAVSNHLSLAQPAQDPWRGTVTVGPDELAWHQRTQLPNLAWSSLAKGFMAGRFERGAVDDDHVQRTYDTRENWARLARAERLAARHGVAPAQVALAYVLNQGFPSFALVGPRTVDELRASANAVDLALTPDDVRWLREGDAA